MVGHQILSLCWGHGWDMTRTFPFKSRGINDQVMITMEENVLMVAKMIKIIGIMNYEQNKLGVAKAACFSNSEVHWFDGVWMAYCGKYDTLSGASSFQCSHHWFLWCHPFSLTSYPLSTTHPSHHHCSFYNIGNWTSASVLKTAATVPGGGRVVATDDSIQVSESKPNHVFCTFQTSICVLPPKPSSFISMT